MARCGRCGLWTDYPDDHPEKKYAGTCLWFQHRLHADEVYESRECPAFFEAIPGASPFDHFDYKLRRDELTRIHDEAVKAKRTATRALWFAIVGIVVSVGGLLLNVVKYITTLGGG